MNYGVIPLVYAGMKVAPTRAARQLGRLLEVGLRRFSGPPYATFLQLDGGEAAIRQVLADPRPGVHLQGMLVVPTAFFTDLAAMGVEVWTESPSTPPGHQA